MEAVENEILHPAPTITWHNNDELPKKKTRKSYNRKRTYKSDDDSISSDTSLSLTYVPDINAVDKDDAANEVAVANEVDASENDKDDAVSEVVVANEVNESENVVAEAGNEVEMNRVELQKKNHIDDLDDEVMPVPHNFSRISL